MLSKTVHLRPLKANSITRVKTPERAARIHERNAIADSNHDFKPIGKTSYDSAVYKFQKEKLGKLETQKDMKQMPPNYTIDFDNYNPCHASDYFIYKKKKFNDQLRNVSHVPTSKVVSSEEFQAIRSSSDGFGLTAAAQRGEEADKRNVYRKNLYVSKPFVDINQDFKFQPLIRNAQYFI